MLPPTVDILLAAFNGERFVAEQIDSIRSQSYPDWKLIIRDDGSSDGTLDICRHYAGGYPGQIRLLNGPAGNLGLVQNFSTLLANSTAPYVMFCDQDDVWLPEKVERQMAEMRKLERLHGADMPLAVFTDALVVDADLRPIANSLLRYINRQRRPGEQCLHRLCVEGNCYGCTMILNRALVERVGRIPVGTISHDWWCGMVAAAFGKLIFVDCAPVKHRRHTSNQSATKQNSVVRYARERPSLVKHRRWLHRVFEQCQLFTQAYGHDLDPRSRRMLEEVSEVQEASWISRRVTLCRHHVWMTGFARNAGFFLAV